MTLLVATNLGNNAYQVGLGGPTPDAAPFELYVPLTGFSISPVSSDLVLNPAGTLATGTVTFPTNPIDGQRLTITSTQTQTAITLTAGTGDTINNAVTALVANTPVTYRYSLNGAIGTAGTNARTWFRSL
jgi:hypothetical protein